MRLLATSCLTVVVGLVVGLFGGCAYQNYAPGDSLRWQEASPVAVRTLGCLDVGVGPFARGGGTFLRVHVGNRCMEPHAFDLGGARVLAGGAGLPTRKVWISDPRGEIGLVHVTGGVQGEAILRTDLSPSERFCVDLAGTAPDAPHATATPFCFRPHFGLQHDFEVEP